MKEWFRDESFWRKMYPYLFNPEKHAIAEAEMLHLMKLIDFKGGDILDMCCGPGRHASVLSRLGYHVVGVDSSPFLLSKARETPEPGTAQNIEWVLQDIRDFHRPESFDLVINMFTSFGYFQDDRENFRVLERALENLKPGGYLVLDLLGKERLARMFQPTVAETFSDGNILIQRNEIINDWQSIRNEWILITNGKVETFRFEIQLYSGREIKYLLDQVGFRSVRVYGDLTGIPYDIDARRLIVTAQKPIPDDSD